MCKYKLFSDLSMVSNDMDFLLSPGLSVKLSESLPSIKSDLLNGDKLQNILSSLGSIDSNLKKVYFYLFF